MHDIKAFPAGQPAADYGRFAAMRERIVRIPRLSIAVRPTPMMEAPNLARRLGGPRIFVKRDDLTGVAFGGNKLRNLDFDTARDGGKTRYRHRRSRPAVQLCAHDFGCLQ